ncbi:MAG: phosphate ABC transporter permease subunit PstC, partial [Acidimicrobiales bacterium]
MAVTTEERPLPPLINPKIKVGRRGRVSELTRGDRITRGLLGFAALLPAAALVFLAYQMFKSAIPSIAFNGFHFFTSKAFNLGNLYYTPNQLVHHGGYAAPPHASYGILLLVFGTLVSSLIALAFAVPISVAGAILLVERLPTRLQGPLGIFLELLAGIPSVVFGLWGVYTFGPLLSRDVYPLIADLHIPWLTGAVGRGQGLLSASLVLAVMIIPIVASTTRELVRSVPKLTKEGAAGLGLTASESVSLVTLPFIRTGVLAAALLGWARALGETIAVLLISGEFLSGYPKNVFGAFASMAATIADILDSDFTDTTGMAVAALAEVGLVLLGIT